MFIKLAFNFYHFSSTLSDFSSKVKRKFITQLFRSVIPLPQELREDVFSVQLVCLLKCYCKTTSLTSIKLDGQMNLEKRKKNLNLIIYFVLLLLKGRVKRNIGSTYVLLKTLSISYIKIQALAIFILGLHLQLSFKHFNK